MQSKSSEISVSLSDLELPFKASAMMDYHEAEVVTVGNQIVVGYLADDSDCADPLEDCGSGELYTAHRFSKTQGDMQNALALNSDWQPDLDLVNEFSERLKAKWVEQAYTNIPFLVWADDTAGPGASLSDEYYKRRARRLWDESHTESYRHHSLTSVQDFECYDDARQILWEELRADGLIGNKYAVSLDCYSHGGEVWSLAGHGMQCRFDTANGAGVWVPSEDCIEELERREKVYAYGCVVKNGNWTRASNKLRFIAIVDEELGGEESEEFIEWHEAFAWLEAVSRNKKLLGGAVRRSLRERRARERAARDLALSDLESYNDWIAGNCYGIVAATFENTAEKGEEPEWSFVESDECWGFIGDDYAMEEAAANARSIAKYMQTQAA